MPPLAVSELQDNAIADTKSNSSAASEPTSPTKRIPFFQRKTRDITSAYPHDDLDSPKLRDSPKIDESQRRLSDLDMEADTIAPMSTTQQNVDSATRSRPALPARPISDESSLENFPPVPNKNKSNLAAPSQPESIQRLNDLGSNVGSRAAFFRSQSISRNRPSNASRPPQQASAIVNQDTNSDLNLVPQKDNIMKTGVCNDIWVKFCCVITYGIPKSLLAWYGMHDDKVQLAWREKIGLCFVAFCLMGFLGFFIFGLQVKLIFNHSFAFHLV